MHKPSFRTSIRNLHALGLADAHADVNACPKGGEPALAWAADYGTPIVVRALLARGAKVNARDKRGRTALHYAALGGEVTQKNVRLLLAAGADVNAKDRDGKTPLMVARGALTIKMLRSRKQRMTLREEIETVLKPLIGERLSDMWRAAGIQFFEIGVQRPFRNRKGQDVTRADQSIDVSCCWSITGPDGEIVSSDDFGPDSARRDEKAIPFYAMLGDPTLTIHTIQADDYGGIRLRTTGGYRLDVWPCWGDASEEDEEQWRLLPTDDNARHFVVTTEGIERY